MQKCLGIAERIQTAVKVVWLLRYAKLHPRHESMQKKLLLSAFLH